MCIWSKAFFSKYFLFIYCILKLDVFRKPNLPKRPQSAPPSRSRYTKENPQIIRSKFKVKPNIYAQPVIVYNGQIHPLPTTDIQPVPSDVLIKPPQQQVLQYTVDESYLKTIDFNKRNSNNLQNNNNIEDDVIVEDIDEEDFDNILPMCNRIIYDENIFNQIQSPSKPNKERPKSARPSSARRRKYIDNYNNNNNNSHRPQSAMPIVTPQYLYIYLYVYIYSKQKRLADTLTTIKITNETKDPESFISKLTDAVFTPIGINNNMPLNNDLLKAEELDNIPSPWVIEHYAY